jgi:hypothetical protein
MPCNCRIATMANATCFMNMQRWSTSTKFPKFQQLLSTSSAVGYCCKTSYEKPTWFSLLNSHSLFCIRSQIKCLMLFNALGSSIFYQLLNIFLSYEVYKEMKTLFIDRDRKKVLMEPLLQWLPRYARNESITCKLTKTINITKTQ